MLAVSVWFQCWRRVAGDTDAAYCLSMTSPTYQWRLDGADHELRMISVPGTHGTAYSFGRASQQRMIEVPDFLISTTPVTQALWQHVMGTNPAKRLEPTAPVENVTWDDVTGTGGFLDRLNASAARATIAGDDPLVRFRLPSETEWEYAARGGPHWRDQFIYSGSNDPDDVAWYGPRWTSGHELVSRILGPRRGWRFIGRFGMRRLHTRTHAVTLKAPNQLGLYDMSGNVWEWCQDVCTDDINLVPVDGSAYEGPGDERRLRGGCHHNWNLHCTVSWRYGITPAAHDGCIGFRVALAAAQSNPAAISFGA
jgi:sulfatase modifying factor 1